jgi:BlaI family transcriptional regulator, penicillinase repressor
MRKPGAPPDIPPPLELECLKCLWLLGEGNVHDVRRALGPARKLAYTTVMTVLDRLARRGAITRRKQGRAFVYSPLLARDTLRRLAVSRLIETFFEGSEEDLISYLRTREPQPEPIPTSDAALDTALL